MESTVVDLDLSMPLPARLAVPEGGGIEAVTWLHGRPLGMVVVPRRAEKVYRRGLARSIVRSFGDGLLRDVVRNRLATPALEVFEIAELFSLPTATSPVEQACLTVAIVTDGLDHERLDRCLAAVAASAIPPAEVIVVHCDRAGATRKPVPLEGPLKGGAASGLDGVKGRVASASVPVRWLEEPSGDVARARCLALEATRSPLVAFVDEAVRVDPHWTEAVCRAFQDHPNASVVTGSVLPDGVRDDNGRIVSSIVESMGWQEPYSIAAACLRPGERLPHRWFNTLQFGTAATVAYRTADILALGGFSAVVAGQAAATGQHFDIWLRALESGHCLVKEPAASCRAAGAPSLAEATADIGGLAAGVSASLVAAAARSPRRIISILLVAQWFLRSAIWDLIRGRGVTRRLAWARLLGHVRGAARAGLGLFRERSPRPHPLRIAAPPLARADDPFRAGRIVPIDLSVAAAGDPLAHDVKERLARAASVPVANVLATWQGHVLGLVEVVNGYRPVTLAQLRNALVDRHWDTLLVRFLSPSGGAAHEIDGSTRQERAEQAGEAAARMAGEFLATGHAADASVDTRLASPPDRRISIVVPTRDRPDDLRECLQSILAQRTDRQVEIIVVDNHPESGLTSPVVAEFAGVRLIEERRQGSSYARNRGLLACRGSIIVCVDDDVVVSDGWLERILAPFGDQEIAVVTGNVMPLHLETPAERMTESFASLSAGSEPLRVDGEWFHVSQAAIQAWDFGVSANIAARSSVFGDPAVGLFAEALGPGTPVGAGEDPYFLYRVVKAGYGLQYCPDAWVWHRHRRTLRGLRRQVYNYSKSAVGYYILTGLRHGDRRSRKSLVGGLQRHYARRLLASLSGRDDVPLWMVLSEISGHLAGAFSFARSEARCRSFDRDPSHPRTPAALPDRSAESERDRNEPWAIAPGPGRDQPTGGPSSAGHDRGRLPHFLVIGAQKSGTSSLHTNLKKHPAIEMVPHFSCEKPGWSNAKETQFFSGHGKRFGVGTLDDYKRLFNDDGRVQGEACPTYSDPRAIARIAETIPDAKLIYICREPVARLESAVNHMMQWSAESPDLQVFSSWLPSLSVEANLKRELADPRAHGLLRMGIYADTVEQVLRHFPRQRLLLLVAEEYRDDPQRVYDTICSFLGVGRHVIDHRDEHVRPRTTSLAPEQRAWLADFYRPHNERFFALLGREVPCWNAADGAAVRKAPRD